MNLERVQRYVMSSLLCSVVGLHSLAMAALGVSVADKGGAREGLFVIAVLLGMLAVAGVRLIFRKSALTPWLLVGFVIPVVTYWVVLWR